VGTEEKKKEKRKKGKKEERRQKRGEIGTNKMRSGPEGVNSIPTILSRMWNTM